MFAKNHISDSLFVVVLKRKSNGPRKRKPKGRAHANHRPTMGSAMSSTSTHGTDMLREGDIATTLKGVLLKGAECAVCGAVKSSDGSAIKRCACKLVYYCSTECQRKDWDDHKARFVRRPERLRTSLSRERPSPAFRKMSSSLNQI